MKTTSKIVLFLFNLSSFYYFCSVFITAKITEFNKICVFTLAMLFIFYSPYKLKK